MVNIVIYCFHRIASTVMHQESCRWPWHGNQESTKRFVAWRGLCWDIFPGYVLKKFWCLRTYGRQAGHSYYLKCRKLSCAERQVRKFSRLCVTALKATNASTQEIVSGNCETGDTCSLFIPTQRSSFSTRLYTDSNRLDKRSSIVVRQSTYDNRCTTPDVSQQFEQITNKRSRSSFIFGNKIYFSLRLLDVEGPTNNRQPTYDKKRSTSNIRQATFDNQRLTSNVRQATFDNQRSTTNERQPMYDNQRSTINVRQQMYDTRCTSAV